MPMRNTMPSKGEDVQPYKYNGKELDRMHGLNTYDYGARQYNPVTGRWDRMDPLCEKYYSISPYAYCANSPVVLVDPDGTNTRTIPHEYGHTLGLEDANLSNVDNVDLTNNLMTQTGFLSSNKVPNYKNVGTITTRLINHITEMHNNGLLNMGSAIYKTIEISYRASLRNFISLKITNKLKK